MIAPKGGGLYRIRCTTNNKPYIGATKDFATRCAQHRRMLAAGVHHSLPLQNAWNKYGADAFVFEVMAVLPRDQAEMAEQLGLDLGAAEWGYNVSKDARTPAHTPSVKAKIGAATSAALRGRRLPAEHRAKIGDAHRGRKHTEEMCANTSASKQGEKNPMFGKGGAQHPMFGKKHTDETRAKLKAKRALRAGKKHTDETRTKISVAKLETNWMRGRTGEKSPSFGKEHTDEARANMSAAHFGKKWTEAQREPRRELARIRLVHRALHHGIV